jgi:prolipoprotein diacylglyceryl transferase
LLDWQIRRGGGHLIDTVDYVPYGLVGVFVGARLGHVLFYRLDRVLEDPLWALKFWGGGLSSHGASIGLVLMTLLYCHRRGISWFEGMDRFTFAAALGATLVRLGNFFNSEVVGRVTDQTWGVRFPRYDKVPDPPLRHPSQLYELLLGLSVLGVLYWVDRKLGREERPRGAMVATFFATYFTGRFFVEFTKEYQTLSPEATLTMGQLLSLPAALAGFVGLAISLQRRVPAQWPETEAAKEEARSDEQRN